METRANYTLVGIVTLIIITGAFGFVYWMATFGKSGESAQLEIRIPGSAAGLSVGAPVLFNGIRIGAVQSLTIDGVDPNFVLAMTEVRAAAPNLVAGRAPVLQPAPPGGLDRSGSGRNASLVGGAKRQDTSRVEQS